ncbi:MAG TPA: SDR family oxidoreductase [Chloroflexota bacterium]|nr:SDR family oxidoreductase [Chloroflexota bacterium]
MRLQDQVALVTGGGSRDNALIGPAIALGYAREGAHVGIVDQNAATVERVTAQVRELGRRALGLTADLTRPDEVQRVVDAMVAAFGRIDILCNALAYTNNQSVFDYSFEEWNRHINEGLTSTFLCCQAVAHEMVKQRRGKIVNITSIVGKLGPGGAVAWAASRGGVDAMTRALAHTRGYWNINVNGLARGNMRPPSEWNEEIQERLRRIPFGRTGTPEDLVGPAIFLASSEADFITGHILYADGGYTSAAVTEDQFRPEWARRRQPAG